MILTAGVTGANKLRRGIDKIKVKFVSTKRYQSTEKIKVIDKDIRLLSR
jgi:hypothetical protein